MNTTSDRAAPLHVEERKQFERLLRLKGSDRMADRLAVVEAFLSEEAHHTAAEWHGLMGEAGERLSRQFVVDTLDLMSELGFCERREFEGQQEPRYEHRHIGEHHDHLICTKCDSITEFEREELEALKLAVARENGFHHLWHSLHIYGLCKGCMSARKPAAPLMTASPGERVRVERVAGGDKVAKQLNAMGISVGTRLEVISNSGGVMMVSTEATRLALGSEVSSRVYISLIS